ncbi:hypothetical protein ABEB36_010379 [Hypothenemus hampei]|uniref:Complex III assembly factor LYRM7 n=1 Tax=Hypothenemus hampei TaxID=57062 RepID=A0ABD1EJQ3_HYPHA
MSNTLRGEVLRSFKAIHKVRKDVFKGDIRALAEGRKKINEEYKKHKHVDNDESIQELVNYAKAVEHELRHCVIQAREVSPGVYQAEIREDIPKLDNVTFNEDCCNNVENSSVKGSTKCR